MSSFMPVLETKTPDSGNPHAEEQPLELQCIQQLFLAQVSRTPDAIALVSDEGSLSYQALESRSNQWARVLRRAGVGAEVLVGISLERSLEMICALFGVLKAGGAYLPLDPSYPAERLIYMLGDAGAQQVISRAHLFEHIGSVPLLDVDSLTGEIDATCPTPLPVEAHAENLAYVIYTSGSTGRPKGAQVPHRGFTNLVAAQAKCLGLTAGQRVLQFAPLSFDASIFEMLMALATGSTLCLADQDALLPGPPLLEVLRRQRVTHVTMPPSVLASLPTQDLPALGTICCAGEALPASLVDQWAPGRRLFNLYGPTEATVWSTSVECNSGAGKPNIGVPIPGVRVDLVDAAFNPVEDGEPGELIIGGIGVVRSYLGRPGMTAERFVPDPQGGHPDIPVQGTAGIGSRLYRSGDLARYLPAGQIDFLGRIDHQVKIHGLRIELGEVEVALGRHPRVRAAAVVAAPDPTRLVAYVVPTAKPGPETRQMRDFLRRSLPHYMVPSSIHPLDALPLLPNGKIDRAALLQTVASGPSARLDDAARTPPTTATEIELASIWSELLGSADHPLDDLATCDDFFSLGGHSLLAGRLVGRLREIFALELPLKALFEAPSLGELAREIDHRRGGQHENEVEHIERVPREGLLPLSFPQERVWFLAQLAPASIAYNSQSTMHFTGPLDVGVYERVLSELIRRHETFRTRFPSVDGTPVQDVQPPFPYRLPVIDLQGLETQRREAYAEQLIALEIGRPFDLLRPPLVRWTLLRLAPEEHILIQVEHHFCHDGWSFAVLLGEMKALYRAFAADPGATSPLPEPPIQPVDFALWQRRHMRGAVLAEHLDYWTSRLAGAPPALELPTDHPRPKEQRFQGAAPRLELPLDFCDGLRQLSRERGMTLFITMLAGFKTFLTRISGSLDLLVGTGAANRRLKESEEMIGMVVNTLVLRTDMAGNPTFAELMERVRATTMGAHAYQDMPLDKLIEALAPERDLARNPIFQVMFSFHDSPVPDLAFRGLEGRVVERHNGSAKADLNVVAIPRAEQRIGREPEAGKEGITLIWEYNTDLFDPDTIGCMIEQYQTLLRGAIANPEQRLSELPLLAAAERAQLTSWSQAPPAPPIEIPVHGLFERAADRAPQALAAAAGDDTLTYQELEHAANRLAWTLSHHDVGPEVLVAIFMEPGMDWVVAIVAVLKAGGAYLPLDPETPSERLAYILEDARVPVVLTTKELRARLPAQDHLVLTFDTETVEPMSAERPPHRAGLDNLAYVIYTSGSTGRPKGSELVHRGLTNLAQWHRRTFGVSHLDRLTQVANAAFDASVWEVWACLPAGASLHFPGRERRADPPRLQRWLAREAITMTFLPTPLGEALWEEEAAKPRLGRSLKTMLLGGDRLQHLPQHTLPYRLFNAYGPSENTVVATFADVPTPYDEGLPPIGRPIDRNRLYVLDRHQRRLPPRVPGELVIGGPTLSRGYLGRPGLSAECFLPNPFATEAAADVGSRIYRTGDLVRYRRDGQLEFLGRIDNQVKVRGFRIELGEIEAALHHHPAVRHAVVLALADASGRKRLLAFVTPRGTDGRLALEGSASTLRQALKDHLARSLPEFMIPAHFSFLDEMPLSTSGKTNRQALEQLARTTSAAWASPGGDEQQVAPRNPREHRIAAIWSQALGIDGVGVHDSFFDLGGHSLLAARLASRIREAFGVQLELRVLFERPTVAELAETIAGALPEGTLPTLAPATRQELRDNPATSFAQERMWFLNQLIPNPAAYHIARAFHLRGRLHHGALEWALSELFLRHDVLRSRFTATSGNAGPKLEILPPRTLHIPHIDLRHLGFADRQAEATRLSREVSARPFDLEQGPLLRLHRLRLDQDEHQLNLLFHHIIFDGWSMEVFLRELGQVYDAARRGMTRDLPELPLRYSDFACWQRRRLEGRPLEDLLAFWRDQFEGAPSVLQLSFDRPRPALQSFRGKQTTLRVSDAVAAGLTALGRDSRSTPFMVLLAAFATLLGRAGGSTDIVIGTPVGGRGHRDLDALLGLFVNTVPLRLRTVGNLSFSELLAQTRDTSLNAFAHQELPLEKLVETLQPTRDLSHSPLFQVLYVFQDGAGALPALSGIDAEPVTVERTESQFDLMLFASMRGHDGAELTLRYDPALFDDTTGQRLLSQLGTLLQGIVADPGQPLAELPFLSPTEHHMLLREYNDTASLPLPEECLHELFETQARLRPEATAVITPTGELTYGELNQRANQLAHLLRGLGAGPLVGVHCERSTEMFVAVLGILKAGAAYVPLETLWPVERIRWIVEHEHIEHIVTQASRLTTSDQLPSLAHVVCLDAVTANRRTPSAEPPMPGTPRLWSPEHLDTLSTADLPCLATPEDLAYIIFTSGSTGRPKGVVVAHQPAVHLVQWVNSTFDVSAKDRLLFVTALSFDLSVYDIFGILAAGGTVRLATTRELQDPQHLVRVLNEEPITFWDSAPAALQQLAPLFPPRGTNEGLSESSAEPTPALRRVFLSGDWIPVSLPDRVTQAFPKARVTSLGGATEATVWSNFFPIGKVDPNWPSIPYGRPMANARYHVLDPHLIPSPIGMAGDLYITGTCLSIGYSRNPQRTAAQYIPDPHSPEVGSRLYRTGDRSRALSDGNLEFLGRLDNQVKVRGFRIELGEIETVLASHTGIVETVVLAREDTPGDQRLVAYLIARTETSVPQIDDLRSLARSKLPEYMVPTAYVFLKSWPLASTGKLDRKALPSPAAALRVGAPGEAAPPPEGNELERAIAEIWMDVLGLEAIDFEQSFFDLGGHSLLMARVHTRLREVLGCELAIVDLFRHPSISSLAEHLSATAPLAVGALTRAAAPTVVDNAAIAIIGMACRFPGASDLNEYWQLLRDGGEAIRFFTDDELRAAGVDDQLLHDPSYVKARGALEDSELFDAVFFGYTPREAQILDPQQRLFLESAWNALEHAGYSCEPPVVRIGVYAGSSRSTYQDALLADPNLVQTVGGYQIHISNLADFLPPRVSYKLNLEGPSINVQTACSTSLVAVHQACLALRQGDCEVALAGGVSIRAREVEGYRYETGGIASPNGQVRAFDAAAAGSVPGSGVGVVVLKPLDAALRDGDTIHAVIRASQINNDGSNKIGFTAPSAAGQALAIRQALAAADLEPGDIDYVETHGTATALGDPIEIQGLTEAFAIGDDEGVAEPRARSCALGSVKTNLGHLDAAAGVAGLIKTTLALRHRQLPPSLHFEQPNPQIDFENTPFYVNTELTPWPAEDRPRTAGLSSFGIGGTNAHVILEEAPPPPNPAGPSRPGQVLLLSAKTPTALDAATANLAEHLASDPRAAELADVAYTLHVGRRAFRHRRFILCHDVAQAIAVLRDHDPRWLRSGEKQRRNRSPVFLFSGQGSQYPGMGAALYDHEAVYRREIDHCAEVLLPELGIDLRDLLHPLPEDLEQAKQALERTALAQPALFMVEYALARLWMSWGIEPRSMLGHSIGEYTAACLAGVFSLDSALRLVALRGRLMDGMPEGDMLAVGLPETELGPWLEPSATQPLDLAAINAPAACVLSGSAEAIAGLEARLTAGGVETRRLKTSHAFHSAMMDPVLEIFEAEVAKIRLQPPQIPFLSNLTGTWITAAEATDPHYWGRHLRMPVRFAAALDELKRQSDEQEVLLEVGPGRALATLARQHDIGKNAEVVTSLPHARDTKSAMEQMLEAIGRLWLIGTEVLPEAFFHGQHRRRVPIPTYPFERQRYGVDFRRAVETPEQRTVAVISSPGLPAGKTRTPRPEEMPPEAQPLATIWRRMLGVEQVGMHDNFFELGGSSLMAIQLGARIREELGVELSADALLEAPTVAELATLLAAGSDRPPSCLVRLQRQQGGDPGRRPLFLVHQAGGQVYTFRALAGALGREQTVYGLRSRGLEAGEEPLSTIDDMARHYLELVREVQGSGPYFLGGASMGGMVAYEMARQLHSAGETVAFLTLMDTPCGDQMPVLEDHSAAVAALFRDRTGITLDLDTLRQLGRDERIPFAIDRLDSPGTGGLGKDVQRARINAAELARHVEVMEHNMIAIHRHAPRPGSVRLLFFRAAERRPGDPPRPEVPWIELARGGTEVVIVPGNHMSMHESPHLEVMAGRLREALDQRQKLALKSSLAA